jgi:hypothetical protein
MGSVLNGTVEFRIANPRIAAWTSASASPDVLIARCGRSQINTSSSLAGYFRGCSTVSATYRTLALGETDITATFIPDLPGASVIDARIAGLPTAGALAGLFSRAANPSDYDTLEVVDVSP